MNKEAMIDELKEICREIGCSGIEKNLCQKEPYKCSIIINYITQTKIKEGE